MDAFESIEWDENKRLSNIDKHYLDFLDAVYVLSGPCLQLSAKTVQGEIRWMAVGMLDDVCVTLIYTMRGRMLRLISMRKARNGEQQQYDKAFGI